MNLLLSFVLISLVPKTWATDDGVTVDSQVELSVSTDLVTSSLPPSVAFARAQAVFAHYGLGPESTNQDILPIFEGATSAVEIKRVLAVLDNQQQFSRFMQMDSHELKMFRDRDARMEEDAHMLLSPTSGQAPVSSALSRLRAARHNSPAQQLQGLRIALDPGHMSTHEWDMRSGKFIQDKHGRILSEGFLTLQTALVLKQELEKLGAQVLLTRMGHEAVSTRPLEQLDVDDFGRKALREKSLEAWFQNLLGQAPEGAALYAAFEQSSSVRALFKPSARTNYYLVREDLDARVSVIENFDPDISLIIHYDIAAPPGDPHGVGTRSYSKVKTYVHGSLTNEEWATQEDRRFVLLHALDPHGWDASFKLANTVVQGLSRSLHLPLDVSGGGTSNQVAPGVFARNLLITRKLHGHAHTFIECLHYNDPKEFAALMAKDFTLQVDGQTTTYSRRLQQVAFAIRDGVVNFVKTP